MAAGATVCPRRAALMKIPCYRVIDVMSECVFYALAPLLGTLLIAFPVAVIHLRGAGNFTRRRS